MNTYNSTCAICFNNNKIKIITECNHYICFNCLCDGGYKLQKCPLCRKKIMKAFLYENNKKILTFDKDTCPHCVIKKYNKTNKFI